MDKTLELNGRKLLFGRVGFFEHVKDACGQDPLEWINEMFSRFKKTEDGKWQITSIVDEVVVYAYAGLNLQADVADLENIALDKAKKWVRTLSFEECGQIINAAVESMAMKQSENGLGEQTSQPVS